MGIIIGGFMVAPLDYEFSFRLAYSRGDPFDIIRKFSPDFLRDEDDEKSFFPYPSHLRFVLFDKDYPYLIRLTHGVCPFAPNKSLVSVAFASYSTDKRIPRLERDFCQKTGIVFCKMPEITESPLIEIRTSLETHINSAVVLFDRYLKDPQLINEDFPQ